MPETINPKRGHTCRLFIFLGKILPFFRPENVCFGRNDACRMINILLTTPQRNGFGFSPPNFLCRFRRNNRLASAFFAGLLTIPTAPVSFKSNCRHAI
ncbi:MAG: hypothetical protein HY842_19455 [Bacteroidetes bacterium]|nr:hypothetical protein [Bacteroidota bacterium]